MNNYDFLVLSPSEFEELSRDLLQKHLEVHFESFSDGKDGGIDLRCIQSNDELIVVQAKRYKDFSSLFQNLNKEELKVRLLKPSRYILTTSVDLTTNNKDRIIDLFSDHNLSLADIYGKKDLNNLLNQFPVIESQYYKLWFSSVNILDKLLHSKVYTQSQFELEEIKSLLKYYVHHESFNDALEILKEHRYLIISGIPGIGKTTLARMLIQYLIAEKDSKFNNFVFLNSTIDEGYELYQSTVKKEQKTIYLFDDFLGKNFLEQSKMPNEDKKITNFIKAIQRDKKDLIVFTTREYILRQSSNYYESFNIENFKAAKCILDLSSYTKTIKAKILYNHLFFSGLPSEYLHSLIKDKGYKLLINHSNYNPRIIETIVKSKAWENCKANNITNHLLEYFDNPQSVWLRAFENSLSNLSQIALLVLLTIKKTIAISKWEDAVISYLHVNNYPKTYSVKFSKTIDELEETFIITTYNGENIIVNFQNPSIQDFLVAYLNDRVQMKIELINSFIYFEQFFSIFGYGGDVDNKVKLDGKSARCLLDKISKDFSKLTSVHKSSDSIIYEGHLSYFSFIINAHSLGKLIEYDSYQEMTIILTNRIINSNIQYHNDIIKFTNLLDIIGIELLEIEPIKLLKGFSEHLESIDDISNFECFINYFTSDFEFIKEQDDFIDIIYDITHNEIFNMDNEDYDSLNNMSDVLKSIESSYNVDLHEERQMIVGYIDSNEYNRQEDDDFDMPERMSKSIDLGITEDKAIENMYKGLLE